MAKCGRKLALMCNNLSIMGPAQCQFIPRKHMVEGENWLLRVHRAHTGKHPAKRQSVDRVEECCCREDSAVLRSRSRLD